MLGVYLFIFYFCLYWWLFASPESTEAIADESQGEPLRLPLDLEQSPVPLELPLASLSQSDYEEPVAERPIPETETMAL